MMCVPIYNSLSKAGETAQQVKQALEGHLGEEENRLLPVTLSPPQAHLSEDRSAEADWGWGKSETGKEGQGEVKVRQDVCSMAPLGHLSCISMCRGLSSSIYGPAVEHGLGAEGDTWG